MDGYLASAINNADSLMAIKIMLFGVKQTVITSRPLYCEHHILTLTIKTIDLMTVIRNVFNSGF